MRLLHPSITFVSTVSLAALGASLASPAQASTAQVTAEIERSTQTPISPTEATPTPTDEDETPSSTNLAAENAQTPSAQTGAQEITVTGSRIRRPDFSTPNPVISVGSDQIEQAGTTNLTDFLTGYPALQSSSGSAQNSGNNAGIGATGLNLLNLRNLGTNRTLVLVDGRRHVAGIPGSQAVDINTIPSDLVERVDVLTGGASAIYGADGVSGVVNFVLKRNFEGISARAQAGVSKYGDGGQRLLAVTVGKNLLENRFNIAVAYEHGEEDRLRSLDRAALRGSTAIGFFRNPDDPENQGGYTGVADNGIPDRIPLNDVRYFDTAREGGIDIDLDGFPDYFVGANGAVIAFDPGRFVPNFNQQGGNGTLVSDFAGDLLPRIGRDVVNLITHFKVSPALTVFAEGKFARSNSFSTGQPSFDGGLYLSADNPFLPASIAALAPDGILLTRDNFDLGPRGEDIRRNTWRGVVGVKGDLGEHANYELSFNYGRTDVRSRYTANQITDRFFAAIDAVRDPATGQITCRIKLDPTAIPDQPGSYYRSNISGISTFTPGQCVPLNLFGENRFSQEALAFITADSTDRSRLTQKVLSGSVAGDLGGLFKFPGGGALGYAIGAEYRKEQSRFTADPLAAQGLTFTNALSSDRGEFDVKEAFGEIRLPLLTRLPFAHTLEVGGAVRFSDYSTIGNTTAYKIDASYAPVRDITFTGTYSTAVRAPNIGELFGGQAQTFEFITDPCLSAQIASGTSFRAANCAALLSSFGANQATYVDVRSANISGFSGGNPRLQEETAKTFTVGVILQPRFISGLSVRADYYNIKLEGAVNQVSAQQLADLCVDQPSINNNFCAAITRQQGPGAGSIRAGNIIGFTVGPQNVAAFKTAGVDVNFNYRLRTSGLGTFSWNVIGNYLDKLEFVGTPGADPTNSRGEQFAPKYTVNSDLTWKLNPFTVNYGVSWFDKTLRFSNLLTTAQPDIVAPEYTYIKERWQHDIYVGIDAAKRFTFYAGVNNLFDQKPDVGLPAYPTSFVGRFFYAGAKIKLDRLF